MFPSRPDDERRSPLGGCVLERIAVEKDVDGFHLYNVGSLAVGTAVFPPCTPYGVQKLLEAEGIPIAGQNVVVVGASNIVGPGSRCSRRRTR